LSEQIFNVKTKSISASIQRFLQASSIFIMLFASIEFPIFAAPPVVRPVAQTASMPGLGDVADDICVWINPREASRSILFGCNKSAGPAGGLYAFQLDGSRWNDAKTWRKEINWFVPGKRINNVDICNGFRAGTEMWDIVAAANRSERTLDLFRVQTDERCDFSRLDLIDQIPIGTGFAAGTDAPYGIALALLDSRRFVAFISDKQGSVAQFEFLYNEGETRANRITSRRFDDNGLPWQISEHGGEVEGIVVDAPHAVVYIASEKEGIFRYRLKDGLLDPKSKIVVDRIGPRLTADVEGLALYSRRDGTGYLLASSQGSSTFAAYQREFAGDKANLPVNNFRIGKGEKIDAVNETDGIEAVCADFGEQFREGIFIAHDGGGGSNYKLVPWSAIQSILKPR
jgi:3-phytase